MDAFILARDVAAAVVGAGMPMQQHRGETGAADANSEPNTPSARRSFEPLEHELEHRMLPALLASEVGGQGSAMAVSNDPQTVGAGNPTATSPEPAAAMLELRHQLLVATDRAVG